MLAPQPNFWRNLRDLPDSLAISAIVAGFINVLVGYSGPVLIVLQAARAGGLSDALASSWLWAIAVGGGVTAMLLSLYYRQPISAPWSTAGAALLVTSLAGFTLAEAIGAYIIVGAATMLLGYSGLFERALALVPQPVVMGMLGGILLRFGIDMFAKLQESPALVLTMMIVFFILRRLKFRAPTLIVLLVGIGIAFFSGQIHIENVTLALTTPIFTAPVFRVEALLTLALPLFVLALTSQYAPGVAVLAAAGYRPPINGILMAMGLGSVIVAPFGGHGMNLGALLAAIITNPDAHPDPNKRYTAGVAVGFFYMLFGLFGATVISLFAGLPAPLVATVAGLAITGTISSSLTSALKETHTRDGAIVAFLCSAANFSLFGIGAPFWGLVAGVAVHTLLHYGEAADSQ
ncbi:MAG: benzoate/H(+) symporter BenE family transporter [Anaerolineae bacterium]|nr:benzoate/H(+) symporter BenE family transporter [Anaerolineae bacterium]